MAVLLLSSVSLYAQEFEVDGICYNVISSSDYTVEVCRSDYKPEIVIPERVSYEGKIYNVTSIGEYAFEEENFTSVNLPDGIMTIGKEAFNYCENLTSINFPSSLKTIGSNAFAYCNKLTSAFEQSPSSALRLTARPVTRTVSPTTPSASTTPGIFTHAM